MGIFAEIKDAIFSHAAAAAAAPAAAAAAPTAAAPADATPAPAAAAPAEPVDVAAVLDHLNDEQGDYLNWQTSIVDMMKLLGIDSSLDHRKALATELHYTGDMDDSASMNIWLHQQVMQQLAANGGKVPADLTA